MEKYTVLDYFQWGQLALEKGHIILVENVGDRDARVTIEHYPEKSQLVRREAVESMVFLKKITRY